MRDFRVMYFDWIEQYEGLRLHNVLAHAQRYVEGFDGVPKTGMHQLDHLTKIESEYLKLMQVEKQKDGETEMDYLTRWKTAMELWTYAQKLILLESNG